MSKESPGSPEPESADAEEHKLDADHAEIRRVVKDLREILERSSPRLSNREQVRQLVEKLLSLVPIRDQETEDLDEWERAVYRGEKEPFADEIKAQEEEEKRLGLR